MAGAAMLALDVAHAGPMLDTEQQHKRPAKADGQKTGRRQSEKKDLTTRRQGPIIDEKNPHATGPDGPPAIGKTKGETNE